MEWAHPIRRAFPIWICLEKTYGQGFINIHCLLKNISLSICAIIQNVPERWRIKFGFQTPPNYSNPTVWDTFNVCHWVFYRDLWLPKCARPIKVHLKWSSDSILHVECRLASHHIHSSSFYAMKTKGIYSAHYEFMLWIIRCLNIDKNGELFGWRNCYTPKIFLLLRFKCVFDAN